MSRVDHCPSGTVPRPDPANIVIFGATGDLTKRKLMPALAHMLDCGLVHPTSCIVGVIRDIEPEAWREMVHAALREFAPEQRMEGERWERFAAMLRTVSGDLGDPDTYIRLAESLETLHGCRNAVFYLAIPPQWYGTTARGLHAAGLAREEDGYRRIVIEKPFGMDLASARALNRELQAVFEERQIYRIDHYLGKESVQNLLVYRFANSIMEPLWNRNYVDHVQISAAETLGIEYRARYYENAGALRDMVQSHLMQVMTLVAMEPPVAYAANSVRDEKLKVLKAVRRIRPEEVPKVAVAAQYGAGEVDGERVPAYVSEPGVSPDSVTETFAAVRFYVDNWRWQGVPFILWTGKRLRKRVSEVMIRFRKPPFNLFNTQSTVPKANALVFRLQPDEGVVLRMNAKMPGLTTDIQRMVMRAPYAKEGEQSAEAYEILLHDVLLGDATLFSRADEVEESWRIVEPILQAWQERLSIPRYRAGTWDVPGMDHLLEGCVGGWHRPT